MTKVFDPKLDLTFERVVGVPREKVWAAWTQPKLLMPWFCPLPWTTVECEIDLRPGGIFRSVMKSPEGQLFPNDGCYLEVVPIERLTWTNALMPGFRPANAKAAASVDFPFTATIALAPAGAGTHYTATVLHADQAARDQHAGMGFEGGWGTALDQLVAMIKAG